MRKTILSLIAAALACVIAAPAALAQDDDPRFRIRLGAMLANFDTSARVDSTTSDAGTRFDLEDDTNLDRDDTEFRAEGWWRFARKHRFTFSYVNLDRGATTVLERDIEFRDHTFLLDSEVEGQFDSTFAALGYRYDFVRRERFEFSGIFAVSFLEMTAKLRGDGTLDENGVPEPFTVEETGKVDSPVPMLGLGLRGNLGGDWFGSAELGWVGYDFGDWDGTVLEGSVRVEYEPFDHVGFGLGWSFVDIEIDAFENNVTGNLDYRWDGLYGFLSFRF